VFIEEEKQPERLALLGVRPCELQAIAIHDRIFQEGEFTDPGYTARRQELVVIAVNCTESGETCFCASTGSGPRAQAAFDLALTELLGEDGHRFLVETGSARGRDIVERLELRRAENADLQAADRLCRKAAETMGRRLDTVELKELLVRNLENPRWKQTAARCLACGNCTMVCPTCFCTTVVDTTELDGSEAARVRRWDSCFTSDFSYIHGGSVRGSTESRYRQWLTHKLASWQDQFGTLGCVGCGRCITWCPPGIDLTEEVAAIRENEVPQPIGLLEAD
jgi:formate hydrogenlyase subunit 6/NADH:ubiquinone oxidoreductase subunit I